ncbi:hypothetical protein K443DRAFT_125038 [Laccaria amethystina LaAM-08-1]|uniref:Uncharacterized protein n=1 Tax=Laccaria amethystina LaAM-08-1 TaxID=1095629 RepID=A0A0C9XFJ7_9AGAR|nr:hypothetical protein K443DRAFT_125038 [Laccaria amethystina LaAM-08-1]
MSVAETLSEGGVDEDQPGAHGATTPGASAPVPEVVNPCSLPPLGGGALGRGGGLLGLEGTLGNQGTLGARGGKEVRHVSSQSIVSDDDDALLAYVLNADADVDDGEVFLGGHQNINGRRWREGTGQARQVRWWSRSSRSGSGRRTYPPNSTTTTDTSTFPNQDTSNRIPPPSLNPKEEEDERALNAVARETSQEIDNLTFYPPPVRLATGCVASSICGIEPGKELGRRGDAVFADDSDTSTVVSPVVSGPTTTTTTIRGVHQQQPRLAQVYAQAYQTQGQSRSPSSAQDTSNPFNNPHDTGPYPSPTQRTRMMNEILPLRLQALTQQSQSQSGGSGGGGVDAAVVQSSSSIGGDAVSTNADTPYRTPGEYPRTLGGTPPKSVSSSSLGGGMVPPGGGGGVGAGGARTISAEAFKRPAPHKYTSVDSLGVGGGGTAPLAVLMKKQLPVSPYPAQQQLQPQRQGHQREPSGQYGVDDEYDYIVLSNSFLYMSLFILLTLYMVLGYLYDVLAKRLVIRTVAQLCVFDKTTIGP